MGIVFDYSDARPDLAAMKAAGAVGVVRYLSSYDPHSPHSKDLTAAEYVGLSLNGFAVGTVWETTALRSQTGYAAGVNDARAANAQADVIGLANNSVVYYATDGNVFSTAIGEYYRGVRDALGRPWGPYGNTALLDFCADVLGALHGWKVATWGGMTANASLMQMPNAHTPIGGVDVNEILKPDWAASSLAPTPTPATEGLPEMIRLFVNGRGWFLWTQPYLTEVSETQFGTAPSAAPLWKIDATVDAALWKSIQSLHAVATTVGVSNVTVQGQVIDYAQLQTAVDAAIANHLH